MMENVKAFSAEGDHLTDEGVALYVDALKLNTLDQMPHKIREHVSGCYKCKEQVTGLFALLDDVDYGNVRSHPSFRLDQVARPRFPRMMKFAAVIAGLAILGTITYFWGSLKQIQLPKETSQIESRAGTDSDYHRQRTHLGVEGISHSDYAANFTEDPELDHLVNGRYRSEAITDVLPMNGTLMDSGEVFSWKEGEQAHVTLSILNNAGNTIVTQIGVSSPFVLQQKLGPGLYYWKIESEVELLYIGKFLVK